MGKIIDRVGEENYNSFGSKMIITKYINAHNIEVYFPEYNWTCKHGYYQHFKEGKMHSPYCKTVRGVGYIGEGDFDMYLNGKATKCYRIWKGMIERCYNTKNIHERNHVYENAYVSDEWLCYQNFAEWFYNNYYEIEGQLMCLDKDILFKGNKEYSDYYCMFVPQNINKLFTKSNKIRGKYPIGVTFEKKVGKFRADCNDGYKKNVFLGYYDTPIEAFEVYKEFKEDIIKKIADKYMNSIPREVYKAMWEYEVEITD